LNRFTRIFALIWSGFIVVIVLLIGGYLISIQLDSLLGIILNLSLPGLALAYQFYMYAMALGLENLGSQGLYKVLGKMNGIDL